MAPPAIVAVFEDDDDDDDEDDDELSLFPDVVTRVVGLAEGVSTETEDARGVGLTEDVLEGMTELVVAVVVVGVRVLSDGDAIVARGVGVGVVGEGGPTCWMVMSAHIDVKE